MICRPIFLSCDVCGLERMPTEGATRETLSSAFEAARMEGWTVQRNGTQIYCSPCMGGPIPDVDTEAEVEVGVVGFSLVPLD